MRISTSNHRKIAARLSTAKAATENAVALLQSLFDEMRAVPEVATEPTALDQAKFNGWLDAIQLVSSSALISDEDLRALLLNEMQEAAIKARQDPFEGELAIYRRGRWIMGINDPFIEPVLAAIKEILPLTGEPQAEDAIDPVAEASKG